MTETAEKDPKSLILVIADMARSNPPLVSSFVAEFARRLQGQSPALALPLTWIEQRLSESGLTIEQLVQTENQQQAADQVSISNSIGSLRFLGAMDWREFVETMSVVETDPPFGSRGGLAPHTGRGGWTWYTGSAGWMYRLIMESLLRLTLEVDKLRFAPCLPADWKSFHVRYRIAVLQTHTGNSENRLTVDGVERLDQAIPLVDDHLDHAVEVRIAIT